MNLETLIEEKIKEFWSLHGNPNTLSSTSQFHPAIAGQLGKVIEGTIRRVMQEAFEAGVKSTMTATLVPIVIKED